MSIMDKQLEKLIIYIYLTMKIAVNYNAVLRKSNQDREEATEWRKIYDEESNQYYVGGMYVCGNADRMWSRGQRRDG